MGAATAMVLFSIGVVAFLWSYWSAVRSREDEIAVSQLYLLLGPAIPKGVRRIMSLVLVAQFAIAPDQCSPAPTGPTVTSGSSLAVGFLVPDARLRAQRPVGGASRPVRATPRTARAGRAGRP